MGISLPGKPDVALAGLPEQTADATFRLTGHFGQFRVDIHEKSSLRRLRSRFAFSCLPFPAAEDAGERLAPSDFRPLRVTYAFDILSGKPHRLLWGISRRGEILTVIHPPLRSATDRESGEAPRLLPVDRPTFDRAVTPRPPVATQRS